MPSKLSPRTCPIILNCICINYSRIRIFIDMKSYSGFITIFMVLLISAKSNAASVSPRSPGVSWMTEELQPVQNTADQQVGSPLEEMAKKLLHILDEMRSLVDIMPADDPNADDDGYRQDSSCSGSGNSNLDMIRQSKLNYLEYYRERILNFTQRKETPLSSGSLKSTNSSNIKSQQVEPLNEIIKKAEERHGLAAFAFRPRMMSLYPTCENSNMGGSNPNVIDLAFDMNFFKPSHDVIINVTSAVLNIYKRPLKRDYTGSAQLPFNKNVTFVAIYFKNPHNKRDSNKKGTKLGEQILRVDEDRWTEWDIKKAIAAWYNNTSRNNGVTIKVADDQIHLPAREFFNIPINCAYITEWPVLTPVMFRNNTLAGISKDLPFLDVTVEEVPKKEIQFAEKEQEFLNGVNVMKQQIAGNETTNSSTEHKIRHHKKNTSKESEANA